MYAYSDDISSNEYHYKYLKYQNGNLKSKASYQHGTRNGNQIDYYSTGEVKRISIYIRGKKEGYRTYFDKSNDILKRILYKNDILVRPKSKLDKSAEKFCLNRYKKMYRTNKKFVSCISAIKSIFRYQDDLFIDTTIKYMIREESLNNIR